MLTRCFPARGEDGEVDSHRRRGGWSVAVLALYARCAGFYAGGRQGVARGGTCAASVCGGFSVAVLARRELRWLVRLRSPRCGARRHVCCLDRRRPVGRLARSTRAALASTLAVATVWREAARVLPRSAAAFPSPCSLYAGCAGLYARGRHGVARGGTYICCLDQRRPVGRRARSTRAALASTLAVATVWREAARICCLDRRRPAGRLARSTRAAQASTLAIATLWRERLFVRGRLESPRLINWKPRRWLPRGSPSWT